MNVNKKNIIVIIIAVIAVIGISSGIIFLVLDSKNKNQLPDSSQPNNTEEQIEIMKEAGNAQDSIKGIEPEDFSYVIIDDFKYYEVPESSGFNSVDDIRNKLSETFTEAMIDELTCNFIDYNGKLYQFLGFGEFTGFDLPALDYDWDKAVYTKLSDDEYEVSVSLKSDPSYIDYFTVVFYDGKIDYMDFVIGDPD